MSISNLEKYVENDDNYWLVEGLFLFNGGFQHQSNPEESPWWVHRRFFLTQCKLWRLHGRLLANLAWQPDFSFWVTSQRQQQEVSSRHRAPQAARRKAQSSVCNSQCTANIMEGPPCCSVKKRPQHVKILCSLPITLSLQEQSERQTERRTRLNLGRQTDYREGDRQTVSQRDMGRRGQKEG